MIGISTGITEAISAGVSGLFNLIDDLNLSGEEKLNAQQQLMSMQMTTFSKVMDYEKSMLELQAGIVQSEAKSEHWLTANWRPITMLWLMALVSLYWFGWTPERITPEVADGLLEIVKWGLSGYVVGRSAEKVAKSLGKDPLSMFKKTTESDA
jgi:hypothetical protein